MNAGRAALAVSIVALVMSMTGLGSAATHAVTAMVDGHQITQKAKPNAIPVLGHNGKLAASMLPTSLNASKLDGKTSRQLTKDAATAASKADGKASAQQTSKAIAAAFAGHHLTAKPQANGIPVLGKNGKLAAAMLPASAPVTKLGGKTAAQLTGSCPTQTVNLGTWCLMDQAYPLTAAETQAGVNDYAWASQACVALGGFLPSAEELIGAANKVRLESVITDNSTTSITDVNNDGGVTSVALDQREMSSSLVTTAAGSDAAGSEGVSVGSTPSTPGQPAAVPQPAVPFPPTLQYVTVYDNNNMGGFAGSEPVSNPENFRCGFYLKQR